MAGNTKNKYLADKTGTKYSEFRNTKRTSVGKIRAEKESRQAAVIPDPGAGKARPEGG